MTTNKNIGTVKTQRSSLGLALLRHLMKINVLAVLLALCCLSEHNLIAQNRTGGEITGLVTDSSGAIVPSATVNVQNQGTGVSVNIQTNASGNYDAPFLAPGVYTVTVIHAGFKTFNRRDIDVAVGQTVKLDVSLTVGEVSEEVTVTGAPPAMQTESSDVNMTLSPTMVQSLPNPSRDVTTLEILAPGVSTAQSQSNGEGAGTSNWDPNDVSVNGGRSFTFNATLNGGTIILANSSNYQDEAPAFDADSEYELIQGNFSAQYGIGTSVVNIVEKTGANKFHGSAFEYNQNTIFDAYSGFFANKGQPGAVKPPFHYNQYGGTLGGPILRNKLFFFFSYQNTKNPSNSTGIFTVPTASMLAGDFSQFSTPIIDPTTGLPFPNNQIPQSRFDSVAKNALAYWPVANTGSANATSNNYFTLLPTTYTTPIWDGNIDWTISPAHELQYTNHEKYRGYNFNGSGSGIHCFLVQSCFTLVVNDYNNHLMERWIINPQMVNAFHVMEVYEHFAAIPPSLDPSLNYPAKLGFPQGITNGISPADFPSFSVSGGFGTGLGPGPYFAGTQNVYSISDALNWVKGKHALTMGGLLGEMQINDPINFGTPGFTFNGQYTGNGFADFLLGDVQKYGYGATLTEFGERREFGAAFIQDDWKVLRNLTLNLGLRYQYEGSWFESHDKNANFSPTAINPATNTAGAIVFSGPGHRLLQQDHKGLFAPRFGFAESIGQKTVVRGGIGVFYIGSLGEKLSNGGPPGYSVNQSLVAQTVATPPVFELQNGPPAFVVPTAASRTGDILNGQSINWWQYDARQGYVEEWNLTAERELVPKMTVQVSYVGSAGRHLLVPIGANQVPTRQLGSPIDRTDPQSLRPFPQYLGIGKITNIASSNYNAFQAAVMRKYANGWSILANYTYSHSVDNSSFGEVDGQDSGDYQDVYALPKSISQFDEPQRVVLAYVYDFPFGQGRQFVNHGGLVDAIVGGWKTSGSFTGNSGYPFTVLAGGAAVNLSGSLTSGVIYADLVGHQAAAKNASHWFSPTNYADPAPYTFGNSGRNSVRNPAFWDFDAALEKTFGLADFGKLTIRADSFNLFNHRNLNQPNNSLDTTASGTITSSTSPRRFELGAHFSF